MGGPILGVIAVVAVAGAAIYGWYANQKRVQALTQFCLSKGWQFRASDNSLCNRWMGSPFGEGHSRTAKDVVTGTADGGTPFLGFDYTYVTGSGRDRTTHRYAVCSMPLAAYLPALELAPDSPLLRMVGLSDIELESEDFNRKYRVTCPDPKFASDVLPPRTMQMLLTRPPLHFRIIGAEVVCWESGSTTPQNLLARTSTLAAFVAGIPGFVWHDHGVSPEGGRTQ